MTHKIFKLDIRKNVFMLKGLEKTSPGMGFQRH